MTVKELIEILSQFDEDAEVVIGMQQRYGSDFMMEINCVTKETVSPWYSNDDDDNVTAVVITEGEQTGVVCYENDDEYEW